MAVPARPSAGNPVASDWGNVVHDGVVAMDIQSGIATVNFANAPTSNSVDVVFPRPFAAPPVMVVSAVGNTYNATANNVPRVDGTNIIAREVNNAAKTETVQCHWIAIGPRA